MLYYLFTMSPAETKGMFIIFSEVFTKCERTGYYHQPDFLTQNNIAIHDNDLEDNDSDSKLNELS